MTQKISKTDEEWKNELDTDEYEERVERKID